MKMSKFLTVLMLSSVLAAGTSFAKDTETSTTYQIYTNSSGDISATKSTSGTTDTDKSGTATKTKNGNSTTITNTTIDGKYEGNSVTVTPTTSGDEKSYAVVNTPANISRTNGSQASVTADSADIKDADVTVTTTPASGSGTETITVSSSATTYGGQTTNKSQTYTEKTTTSNGENTETLYNSSGNQVAAKTVTSTNGQTQTSATVNIPAGKSATVHGQTKTTTGGTAYVDSDKSGSSKSTSVVVDSNS